MGCGGDNYFDGEHEYESWVTNYSVGDIFEGPIANLPKGRWMITKIIPETNQQLIDEGYGFDQYEMVPVGPGGGRIKGKTLTSSNEHLSHAKAQPITRQ